MQYGLPYKGSKNGIAAKLIKHIPKAEAFVDVFAGGCAMTHAAMLSGNFTRFFANDIGDAPRLFLDAVNGKYRNETRWISREDFFRLKDTDPYVRTCWSFGNNGRSYLYSRAIEPYKKACHYAVVLDDWSLLRELCPEVWGAAFDALRGVTDTHERRIKFGPAIVRWLKGFGTEAMIEGNPLYRSCHTRKDTKSRPKGTIRDMQRLQSLESLERLESLQRLESLERLESLQRLQISQKDYREVSIPDNAVVYCDPPYKWTDGYGKQNGKSCFDHEAFYEWCEAQQQLTIISEYDMPEERFAEVFRVAHRSKLSQYAKNAVTERLFVPRGQLGLYWRMMKDTGLKKPRWEQLELFP